MMGGFTIFYYPIYWGLYGIIPAAVGFPLAILYRMVDGCRVTSYIPLAIPRCVPVLCIRTAVACRIPMDSYIHKACPTRNFSRWFFRMVYKLAIFCLVDLLNYPLVNVYITMENHHL